MTKAKKQQAPKPIGSSFEAPPKPVITDGRVRDSYEGFLDAIAPLHSIAELLAEDRSREGLVLLRGTGL